MFNVSAWWKEKAPGKSSSATSSRSDSSSHDIWNDSMPGEERPLMSQGGMSSSIAEEEQHQLLKGEGGNSQSKVWWMTKKGLKTHLPYYIPIFEWVPRYGGWKNFGNDLAAGLAVAALLIPQSIAFATLAYLPAEAGLYTALCASIVYGVMGTSRQMSIGPEATGAILLGMMVQEMEPASIPAFIQLLTLLTGLLLLLMGIFRFGFIDNILSKPLLSGFINAIALTVIFEQLEPLLGLPTSSATTLVPTLKYIFQNSKSIDWNPTFSVGITSIITLFSLKLLKKFTASQASKEEYQASLNQLEPPPKGYWIRINMFVKYIPDILLVAILGIIVSWKLDFKAKGVKTLGSWSEGLPTPTWPHFTLENFNDGFGGAVVVGIVGFVESILVARFYANKHGYRVSPNRELVALGVVNAFGSFFQSMTAFGSIPRSAVNDASGSTSQLAGVFSSIVVLLTILFLSPLFSYLPMVILAAIIIVAACSLLEVHEAVFFWKIRAWKDLVLLLLTIILTLTLGVEWGLFISLGISVLMIIKHTSIPQISILGKVSKSGRYKDTEKLQGSALPVPGLLVLRIEEALYFANIGQVKEIFDRMEQFGRRNAHPSSKKTETPFNAIVFDAKGIPSLDGSALQVLADMSQSYRQRGIKLSFARLRPELIATFERGGIIHKSESVFSTVADAVDWCLKSTDLSG